MDQSGIVPTVTQPECEVLKLGKPPQWLELPVLLVAVLEVELGKLSQPAQTKREINLGHVWLDGSQLCGLVVPTSLRRYESHRCTVSLADDAYLPLPLPLRHYAFP